MNLDNDKPAGDLHARAAHLGVGAFHRAHQQSYYDDLALSEPDGWGVVGVNLTPPDLHAVHVAQQGRYSLLTEDGDGRECREIRTLLRVHDAASAATMDWSGIDFLTLTITEKGYCHRSGTRELDVQRVAADLASPRAPGTAIGYLAWMLEQRRLAGGRPITLASCDNVADNGQLLESVLRSYAEKVFPALDTWLDSHVAFPISMVDRIVPVMSTESRRRLESARGQADALGVVAEPFRQWVIQDRFAGERPALERVGVQVVDDLALYEHMKHRLLNGLQSAYAELGRLCGHESSFAAATDPALIRWADRFFDEQRQTLVCPPGEDLTRYAATSLKRLQNPTIHHPLNQIASDASFKLPQRIATPAAECLQRGLSAEPHAMVLAAWALQCGDRAADSSGVVTEDPLGPEVLALRQRHAGSAQDLARATLALPLWPAALSQNATFVEATEQWIQCLSDASPTHRRERIAAFLRTV